MKKNKLIKIVIITAILIIPLMYSFFYLKAFWNPYGNLKELSVGIVNLDEGDNKENLGSELANKIKNKDVMKFEILNEDEAEKLLSEEKCYALIKIPKDFTKTLNNAENKDRKITTITYSPNQKSNYLASQIINKVVISVQQELTGEINEKIVANLKDKLNEVPNQMEKVSDGAGELKDGTKQLTNGIKTINNGTNKLASNYEKFDNGINSVYNGSTELENGIQKIYNGSQTVQEGTQKLVDNTKNLGELNSNMSKFADAGTSLENGIGTYVDSVNGLLKITNSSTENIKNNIADIQKNLQTYIATNPQATQDSNIQGIIKDLQNFSSLSSKTDSSGTQKLIEAGNTIKEKTGLLNEGIKTLYSKTSEISKISDGAIQINEGIKKLQSGILETKNGSQKLNVGLNEININSKQIQIGINSLNNGTKSALDGSQDLANGVDTLKTQVDEKTSETKEKLKNIENIENYAQEPVEIQENDYAKIDAYGVAFAPYFISISLWIGNLMSFVVLYYDQENRFKILGKNSENKKLRLIFYGLISIAQAIILGFLLKLGLGFSVTNTFLYYGTCILTSLVFLSIIQFLIMNFKDVGKFIALILLVLQLAASGGTFPIETVPNGFQAINHYLPMTYTVKLLKESLVSINSELMYKNMYILIGIAAGFLILNTILLKIKNRKKA